MVKTVLICDDSALARKQLHRSLPTGWDVEVLFAKDGQEGATLCQTQQIDLMFLDLTMPVMDGYQVLEALQHYSERPDIVVVSGDIQAKALERVTALGAAEFLRKPASKAELQHILERHGWYTGQGKPEAGAKLAELEVSEMDAYRELANVAMGRAGGLMAEILNLFVKLPIPNVNVLESSELHMALQAVDEYSTLSAVCQGFIGDGISGEAFLLFDDTRFDDMSALLGHDDYADNQGEIEVLMDLSNILIGACLKGIADMLHVHFSQGHPVVLGQHCQVNDLIAANQNRWQKNLAIEINYKVETHDINCDLLLVFTEESLPVLRENIKYMLEES
ncbi:response regulator [Neiella sp. HB171785]|uniref:Response regulator n=1 Tax=Neiella litorisoli TaxID=2771431 RepID=A0A8J6QWD6_9GAMM|nr:response regulator [Neiella litorisoli]